MLLRFVAEYFLVELVTSVSYVVYVPAALACVQKLYGTRLESASLNVQSFYVVNVQALWSS